jgi:hypothetical protein
MKKESISEKRAKGGEARAKALTAEERKEIARKAALVRWNANVPQATHEADFNIGSTKIFAAVLPNGKRLISQASFLRALGRSRSPKAGTGVLSTVDGLPFFLQAEALLPFISDELRMSTTPIFFLTKDGKRAVGYDAELLPMVCEVYLKLRDERLATTGEIPATHKHIVKACDILMRGLAHVGIVALVDEATGYQEVRDRNALQALLDRYLRKELAAWAKCFPDEFYKEIFRLQGWEWQSISAQRPRMVGKLTKDVVYARLEAGIVKELEARNPANEKGYRKARHHQWLTEDIGHSKLAQHLHAVIALMRISRDWDQFKKMLDRAFPKRGDTLQLPFMAEPTTSS